MALLADSAVPSRVSRIFPVRGADVQLPYLVYRRKALIPDPVKGARPADTVQMEIVVCTAGYDEGVELAEAVRAVFDGCSIPPVAEAGGLGARRCSIAGAEESIEGDAYLQILTFNFKIQSHA